MFPILIYFKMYLFPSAFTPVSHVPSEIILSVLKLLSFLIFFWTGDTFFFELKINAYFNNIKTIFLYYHF